MKKNILILLILILIAMVIQVNAESRNYFISNGEKVYWTYKENNGTFTVKVEGTNISVTGDSLITAQIEARVAYEGSESYKKAVKDDNLDAQLNLEGIEIDGHNNHWLSTFLRKYAPGLIKVAINFVKYILYIGFTIQVASIIIQISKYGLISANSFIRAKLYASIFSTLVLLGLDIMFLAGTTLIEYIFSAFIFTIVFSGSMQNLANTAVYSINSFTTGFVGLGILSFVLALIIRFIKLGVSASNPRKRSMALDELGSTIIFLMMLGAVNIIVGLVIHIAT